MPNERYPKRCFLRQKSLSNDCLNLVKYNWVQQIKDIFFEPINEVSIWDSLTSESLKEKKHFLIESYKNYLYNLDIEKRCKSTSVILYPELD